jgi:F-type H+-transporting ATPase subunit b
MPQLDPTSFPPQLVWLAITFIALYLLMARLALPKVGVAIERRRDRIDGDLDKAAKLKSEIDVVIQVYERALAEARAQAAATVNATTERLAQVSADRQRQSMAALAEQTKAAEASIEKAKAAALANVRTIALEAAKASTQRLIGQAPEDARVAAAVDLAMKRGA